MARDREAEALRIAAASTLERIRSDRARAPGALKKVFTVVARDLFELKLNARWVWAQAGIRNHAWTAVFKDLTGVSLKPYIAGARIEVAEVLLQTSNLKLSTISVLIGYLHHPTFTDNYVRVKKLLPSKVLRMPPKPRLIDDATSLRAGWGEFDEDEAVDYLGKYLRIYPHAAKVFQPAENATPELVYVIGGDHTDPLIAEGLWQKIRNLPFEEQCRHVRQFLFHSTVLFDLLRKKSRLEGRKSRRRGIEVAKLALVSLEMGDDFFGERIHDLRALGWAWVGHSHRLALDFSAADAAFVEADWYWHQAEAPHALSVAAEIGLFKGTLRMSQRSYPEALEWVDRARDLFRLEGDREGETGALIQQAAIQGYSGSSEEAICTLEEAKGLLGEHGDPRLAFAIYCNLANDQLKLEDYESASRTLKRCKRLRSPGDSTESLKLLWIEGGINQGTGALSVAEQRFTAARAGYSEAEDPISLAMISLDLAILYSEQERWAAALDLALQTVPILASLQLYKETVAAVSLLSKAVDAGEVPPALLRKVRDAVELDPLAACAAGVRLREFSGPHT